MADPVGLEEVVHISGCTCGAEWRPDGWRADAFQHERGHDGLLRGCACAR